MGRTKFDKKKTEKKLPSSVMREAAPRVHVNRTEILKPLLAPSTGTANKAIVNGEHQIVNDGLAESLRKYRKATENLNIAYMNYMKEITGSADDYEAFAKEQIDAVEKVLQKHNSDVDINSFRAAHDNIKKFFDNSQLDEVNQGTLISSEFFRLNVGYFADRTALLGKLEATKGLSETTRKAIYKTLKAFTPNAEELGFDKETIEFLDHNTKLIYNLDRQFKLMEISENTPELHDVYTAGAAINQKILNYIKTGDEAFIPTTADFNVLADACITVFHTRPLFGEDEGAEKSELDVIGSNMINLLEDISVMCPDVKAKYDSVVGPYKTALRNDYLTLRNTLATADVVGRENTMKYAATFDKIKTLYNKQIITKEELEKSRLIMMSRNVNMMDREIEMCEGVIHDYAKHMNGENDLEKTLNKYRFSVAKPDGTNMTPQEAYEEAYTRLMQAKYVQHLTNRAEEIGEHTQTIDLITKAMDDDLYRVLAGASVPDGKLEKLESVLYAFRNGPTLQQMKLMSPDVIAAKIDNHEIDSMLEDAIKDSLRNKINPLAKISREEAAIFADDGSESYRNVGMGMREVSMSLTAPGDNLEAASNFYSALKTYVSTHDSRPFHDYGKERFNAAAKMMGQMSFDLMKADPDNAQAIKADMRLLMLRNKPFRTQYIESLKARINELGGQNGKLTSEGFDALSPEFQSEVKEINDMISFGVVAGNILDKKTKHGQVTGKLSEKNQAKLLDEYSVVADFNNSLSAEKINYSDEIEDIDDLRDDMDEDRQMYEDHENNIKYTLARMAIKHELREKIVNGLDSITDAKQMRRYSEALGNEDVLKQLVKEDEFQIFFNSVTEKDLNVLDPNNKKKSIDRLTKSFSDIRKMSAREKSGAALLNAQKRSDIFADKFSLFFKSMDGYDRDRLMREDAGRFSMSVGRTALESLAIGRMLADGHSLDDILNPNKLVEQRETISTEIMNAYNDMEDDQFKAYCEQYYAAGMNGICEYIDSKFNGCKDITPEFLGKSENINLYTASVILNDMGQEFKRFNENDPILNKQLNTSICLKKLYESSMTLSSASLGANTEQMRQLPQNLGTASLEYVSICASYKNWSKSGKLGFTEAFGNPKNKDVTVINNFGSAFVGEYGDELQTMVNESPENIKKFADKALDKKLFSPSDLVINKQTGGVSEIKGFYRSINKIKSEPVKASAPAQNYVHDRKAQEDHVLTAVNNAKLSRLFNRGTELINGSKAVRLGEFTQGVSYQIFANRIMNENVDPQTKKGLLSEQNIAKQTRKIQTKILQNTGNLTVRQLAENYVKNGAESLLEEQLEPVEQKGGPGFSK